MDELNLVGLTEDTEIHHVFEKTGTTFYLRIKSHANEAGIDALITSTGSQRGRISCF